MMSLQSAVTIDISACAEWKVSYDILSLHSENSKIFHSMLITFKVEVFAIIEFELRELRDIIAAEQNNILGL